MVGGALNKRLVRRIIGMWGQALAIIAVVFLGAASYITGTSAHQNLLLSRDAYYDEYRFADFFISLERAPNSAAFRLEDITGVREVRGRIVKDALVDLPGIDEPRNVRMVSMPERRRPVLNDVHLAEGRYFDEGVREQAIISAEFAQHNDIAIGDRVQVTIDGRRHSLRVMGYGHSPEYIYLVRSAQDLVPDAERFGILWVPEPFAEMALDMTGAYNDFTGTVDDPAELDAILDRTEQVLDPYGVFSTVKQEDQLSHRFVTDQIEMRDAVFAMIAVLFLAIAASVLMVLLNRMVRQERTEIGLLKAFGYSNMAIGWYYIKFALIVSIAGCFLGMVLGHWLSLIFLDLYVQFYHFPILEVQFYPKVYLTITLLTAVFASAGALSAARQAARTQPAEAMRPEAPRHGHRTFIEGWAFLWTRLGFTSKMIVRNIGRNRFRAAFNVAGVMIAAAILLVGFHQMDSVTYMVDLQFTQIQREDVRVHFITERGRGALYDMARMTGVRRAEPLLQYPFELRNGWRHVDTGIIGVPSDARMTRLLDVNERPVEIRGPGLILAEALADELGVRPGDSLRIKPLMGKITRERDVQVRKVVQQYLGSAAYMEIGALSRFLDEPFAMNVALLEMHPDTSSDLVRYLKDVPIVAAVELSVDAYASLQEVLADAMAIMATTISLFGGIIAFAIIYNTTIISLVERQRELASLRVMGFTKKEIARILYRENVLLSAVGLLLGIPLGRWLCQLIVDTVEMDMLRLPFHLEPESYVKTISLTALFVLLANLAVLRRIHTLDLVEVLKQRE